MSRLHCFSVLPRLALAGAGLFLLLLADCRRQSPAEEMRAAGQALRQHKYATAVIEYRRALQQRPRSVRASYGLARAELALKDWPAAFTALRRCLVLNPNFVPARLNLARLYFFDRQYDNAIRQASRIIQGQPQNAAAWQVKAAAEGGAGRLQASQRDFRHLTQLQPRDPNAWINLALMDVRLHQLAPAGRHLRRAQALAPALPLAYLDLAGLARVQGDAAAVPVILRQGIAHAPKSIALYLALANDRLQASGRPAAEAVLGRLRAVRPRDADVALRVGDFCYQSGFFRQARRSYRRGLQSAASPIRLTLQHHLLRLELHLRQWSAAQALALDLLRRHPGDFDARLAQARLWLQQNRVLKASGQLHVLVSNRPGSAQASYYLGLAEWAQGDRHSALQQLQLAHQNAPRAPNVVRGLARMNLAMGRLQTAWHYAQIYQALAPRAPASAQLLGTVALARGDWAAARAALQQALAASPGNLQLQLLLAQADLGAGRPAAAGQLYASLLASHPHSSAAAGAAINFFARRSQWPQALQVAQNYSRANPRDAQGSWLLATIELQRNQLPAAAADLHRALQRNPRLLSAVLDLGRLRQQQNNLPRALYWYQRASVLQPDFPPLLTMIGNLYLAQDNLDRARQYYRQALAADSQFALAQANLAWVYAQQQDNLPQALILAQQAARRLPNTASVVDTLAWVYFRMHSFDSAIPLLRRCVAAAPANPMFRYHLGRALLAGGHKREGRRQLERALQLNLPAQLSHRARGYLVAQN